jgi:ribosome-binding factor A
MSTRRTARVASMIREVVSTAILFELRDPRIKNVTVLGADVSPDLRYASVRISVMGDDKDASLTMHGLNSARGYLQSKVAEYIKSRYTPELRFVIDDGIKKALATSALLRDVLPESSDMEDATAGFALDGMHQSEDPGGRSASESAEAEIAGTAQKISGHDARENE